MPSGNGRSAQRVVMSCPREKFGGLLTIDEKCPCRRSRSPPHRSPATTNVHFNCICMPLRNDAVSPSSEWRAASSRDRRGGADAGRTGLARCLDRRRASTALIALLQVLATFVFGVVFGVTVKCSLPASQLHRRRLRLAAAIWIVRRAIGGTEARQRGRGDPGHPLGSR